MHHTVFIGQQLAENMPYSAETALRHIQRARITLGVYTEVLY